MLATRREFLGAAAAMTLGFSTVYAQPPKDRLRVGVIGTGVRGKYLIGNLPSAFRVTALCDCATSRMNNTRNPQGQFTKILAGFAETDARTCAVYQDYRRLFDKEKLDAVIIATPDHHHVLPALLALQAGLDVYLEKPLSLTIREGRLLADMVRKTGRVLQVGSQQRTMEINRFACEFLRNGGLGKISHVDLPNYPGPLPDSKYAEEPIPEGLDWNLFCGPTELRPHHSRLWNKEEFKVEDLLWRGWDLHRAYSGHLMTNWGGHSVDMVQLALGRDHTGPVRIEVHKPDSIDELWKPWKAKTPKPTHEEADRRFWPVTMYYADGVELRFRGEPDFLVFHGEKGKLRMKRNAFETDPPGLAVGGPNANAAALWEGAGHVARPHLENWLECIRTRKTPNAPVEAGHRTATICHLANLVRELNRPLRWDPTQEQFLDDARADLLLDRPRREGFALPQTR